MAERLTPQQKAAVENRGGRLLVSAAAGSGKTKVLVDRLIGYIIDPVHPANIDDFLIITYTKAAAAELRGKIAAKLTEKIALHPENRHLQRQMQRIYLTKISTVHSFCTDILREYAYMLDISADFRVAEESETNELQLRAIQQLLDDAYASSEMDPDFCAFLDSQGLGRDDRQIPEIVIKTYNSAMCHLDPNGWLDWCLTALDSDNISDASETVWGKYLIDDLKDYLQIHIQGLQQCASRAAVTPGMEKPTALLYSTIDQLITLEHSRTWDEIHRNSDINYGKLVFSRKCSDIQLAEQIKTVRDACKKGVGKKLRRFAGESCKVLADMTMSAGAARGLVCLTKKFSAAYDMQKRSRRVLDFGDLEQRMLDLLLGRKRSGCTAIAREIGRRYREVMVDEYQDSNAVQDAIFRALTEERSNCFMVGDVKQSIYQFRLADPNIFLEKYNTFISAEEAKSDEGRKVLLSKNFRSSGGVIDAVNDVFSTCMSPEVGGLLYGEQELLAEGIPHIPLKEPEVVLYGIDVQENTYAEEAAFTAEKILSLLDGSHLIRDGDSLRPVRADDIVILLRSPGSVGGEFCSALEKRGIPCTIGGTSDVLQSEEIRTLRALLDIIHNPLQDIPLITVLTSRVFGFTADDLARIRGNCIHGDFYTALCSDNTDQSRMFLAMLKKMRFDAQMNTISRLLMHIFAQTRIDSIFASLLDGSTRLENLQAICQMASKFESTSNGGLDRFLEHLSAMEDKGLATQNDQSVAGAVTIMSIHKSKGLEFPVVFLCGLSRCFNAESTRAQVLCDSMLGLGLSCVDFENRVRYPSIAKHAITAKISADGLSEEMRVLYVAMTRARDRLIMTYAARNIESELSELSMRMAFGDPKQLARDADCPGYWILMTAIKCAHKGWSVIPVNASDNVQADTDARYLETGEISNETVEQLRRSLSFSYDHISATTAPSKQTATQLKGREKDSEIAEHTKASKPTMCWRKPYLSGLPVSGSVYGSAIHKVMQHISYRACTDPDSVEREIQRLVEEEYLPAEQGSMVNPKQICDFFATEMGRKLQNSPQVLREFKFSILDDADKHYPEVKGERILLQGVVDCAIVESDGIVVIDFKSDHVTNESVGVVSEKYREQITAYANALERIYQMPIKSAQLYFFCINRFVPIL